jgi:hypothetical protein
MERFSSAATFCAAPQRFHMERAILLTLSIPAVAFLGVSSLTLTNSAQESRFYLIMMII